MIGMIIIYNSYITINLFQTLANDKIDTLTLVFDISFIVVFYHAKLIALWLS